MSICKRFFDDDMVPSAWLDDTERFLEENCMRNTRFENKTARFHILLSQLLYYYVINILLPTCKIY